MLIPLVVIIALLVVAVSLLFRSWSKSGWLIDRRTALARTDRFIEDLNVLVQRFPHLSSELDLSKVNDGWVAQRAEIAAASSFLAWLRGGRPSKTFENPETEALFRFARTQAGPISYSIDRIEDQPSVELINRINATIDPRTGRCLMETRFVRLSKPNNVARFELDAL